MRQSVTVGKSTLCKIAEETLLGIQAAGTYKTERVLRTPQRVSIATTQLSDNVLNMCANNYLGLANNLEVVAAAKHALDEFGFGMSSVRFICGTNVLHKQYESYVSTFLGKDETILYPSCFDANAGIFEALLGEQDLLISDALNHASLIDGIRLCKARRERYRHMDMQHLEEILRSHRAAARVALIVTDGIFSMDGDIAPLDHIVTLAKQYDCSILVDDSHATGYFGPQGKGTPHHFGVEGQVELITSTMGKALGGASGGFCAGPTALIELQRQRSRPYLFSNSVAPAMVAGSFRALELATQRDDFRVSLARNIKLFRDGMKQHGFRVMGNDLCAIAPVWIGDAKVATEMAQRMLTKGIYVIGFSYPVVPKDEARIRVQLSADHTAEDISKTVEAFCQVRDELKDGLDNNKNP